MQTIDEILKQASALSREERRKLIDLLEEGLADEQGGPEEARQAALHRWLARAGTGHSDFVDVSSDKYKHLGAVFADEK
jgi:predicted transcriptional regulator